MLFYKNVLLLKEVTTGFSSSPSAVSGILRLEQEETVSSLSLTLINVKNAGGEYRLFLCFDRKTAFSFPLGARPFSFTEKVDFLPSADHGFSAGLVFVKDFIPTVVAFAKTDGSALYLKDFKKAVAEWCIKDVETVKYDDEVVATENYFDDSALKEKLDFIKNLDDEYVQNKDALFNSLGKIQEEKGATDAIFGQDETDGCDCEERSQNATYYLTVKKDLDRLLCSFPPEEDLNRLSPDGKWVKVSYGNKKFYVVGVLKEDGKEKYICYGVPSKYAPTPPKELDGFATFVPLSVFNLKGDGYFIMFQDAVTGRCVKPE